MLLPSHMDLKLVRAVAVELTGVAPQFDRIDTGDETQLPLVGNTALLDVVDMAKSLQVLVCLTVQLEIGLQVSLVVAELTEVVPSNYH